MCKHASSMHVCTFDMPDTKQALVSFVRVFSSLLFVVLFFLVALILSSPVSAVDDGCNGTNPYCVFNAPANWVSGQCGTPSFELPGGDIVPICNLPSGYLGNSCCNVVDPDPAPGSMDINTTSCNEEGEICCTDGVGEKVCSGLVMCNTSTNKCTRPTLITCSQDGNPCCKGVLPTQNYCGPGLTCINHATCVANDDEVPPVLVIDRPFDLCKQASNPEQMAACSNCFEKGELWTAVGCIPISTQGIIDSAVKIAIGVIGGFLLLGILAASFILSTSQGDPNKTKQAQEMYTSLFAGVLFLLFGMVLLGTIGVNILQIPGF